LSRQFCFLSPAPLTWRPAGASSEPAMILESIVSLVIAVGLLAYLVYAMLRPEKF